MIYVGTAQTRVDKNSYNGWEGKLSGTLPDIVVGAEILKSKVRKNFILKDEETTVKGYIQLFTEVSKIAEPGELIVWWDSGHGCQRLQSAYQEEGFVADQGIAAFDGIISDNQVAKLLGMFKGNRIVYGCDRCHSGSMYRNSSKVNPSVKAVPREIQKAFTAYDYKLRDRFFPVDAALKSDLKYFGACQENQYAMDLGYNGKFTYEFWACYKKNGNVPYISLFRDMLSKFPPTQTPKYTNLSTNKKFNTELAFTV